MRPSPIDGKYCFWCLWCIEVDFRVHRTNFYSAFHTIICFEADGLVAGLQGISERLLPQNNVPYCPCIDFLFITCHRIYAFQPIANVIKIH